jgi:hypothetical protein
MVRYDAVLFDLLARKVGVEFVSVVTAEDAGCYKPVRALPGVV